MTYSSQGGGQEKRAFAPIPDTGHKTGTALAIMSVRLLDAKHGFIGRGGPRNRADRASRALSPSQVELLIGATHFALHIGLPFNRHITVHWKAAGIPDNGAAAATCNLIKRASDWVRYAGQGFAAAWVRENDAGNGSKGSHVHILAHVPKNLAHRFFVMFKRWLKSIRATRKHEGGTQHTERIKGYGGVLGTTPGIYLANLGAVLAYVVKGASEAAANAFDLERLEDGGIVIGKRAGTTQNIGRTAWQRAGWRAQITTRSQQGCFEKSGGANG